MHSSRFIAPFLALALASCASGPAAELTDTARSVERVSDRFGRTASAKLDRDLDVIQRTCALYVAVRSHAWKDQVAFGRDMDADMVQWNKCPGGTMVACVVTPTANGDTVITGVPFTHGSTESN